MARYAKFFSVGAGGGGTNNLQLPVGTILDATLRQVQDGLGTGSPLYLSTRRVGITSDSSVTTQVSSVIQATTTNANLVIAPNGTGALIASIPDGTATGGNARGVNSVDLQMARSNAAQIVSGSYSIILAGASNKVTKDYSISGGINCSNEGRASILFGNNNTISLNCDNAGILCGNANTLNSGDSAILSGKTNTLTSAYGVITGGQGNIGSTNSHVTISGGLSNTVSSQYGTVSGGQSNTASTGTHATVVGGQSNVSSGQYSISGGQSSTASGLQSFAIGFGANCSGNQSFVVGGTSTNVSGRESVSLGGQGGTASGLRSLMMPGLGHSSSADYSVSHGQRTLAYLYGQLAYGGYAFATTGPATGDSQFSNLVASKLDTLTTAATTVLSLDGTGTTNLIIPNGNNRLWAVKVVATAFVSVAGGTLVLGDSYMGEFTLLFKRVGGTSSVVGVNAGNIIYDTNMATAAFTFAAGASQDLQITFKAPTTATATTFRCVAKVELVEVAY